MNGSVDKHWPKREAGIQERNGYNGNSQSDHRTLCDNGQVQTKDPKRDLATAAILLAGDCAVTRRGVRVLLETQPHWKVVAETGSGREAARQAIQLRPDIIILSVNMQDLNGLDATRLILKAVPNARVLVLTTQHNEEMIERALQAGVRGYVLKSDAEADLVDAVNALLLGRTFFTSAASEVLVEHLRREREETAQLGLTIREAEVVQLLAEGKTNKEVAAILDISSRTVENHRAQIMDKLGLQSFSELVRYAIRVGIVEP
jgi:DNA-binding NarL/FixJ family response regulator